MKQTICTERFGAAWPREALPLPLFLCGVSAGFPSPADDYIDKRLDLNEHLVRRPASTFFVRAAGHSMAGAGIGDGDLLVVDRSAEPAPGRIVIAAVNGELTVKRLVRRGGRAWLAPEAPGYAAIELTPETDVEIWGVVLHAIRSF